MERQKEQEWGQGKSVRREEEEEEEGGVGKSCI